MSRRAPDPDHESLVERSTHDLLNPVAAILGIAETIRARGEDLPTDTLRELAASISRQASVLESSIRDLARATRLERGDPPANMTQVHLSDVTAAVAPLARVRVEVARDLTARADRELLAAALSRLVANALEHSSGEVVVRGGLEGARAYLEVVDAGWGFTSEGLDASFAPLAAGTNVKGERGSGLGLGLYIAQRLVEAQGGAIEAESEPGVGTRFRIALPA